MIELLRTAAGAFFWRLKAANGEALCHSEVYTTKQAAIDGINAAKRNMDGPIKDLT